MKNLKSADRAIGETLTRRRLLRTAAFGTGIVASGAALRQLPFAAAHPGHGATPEGSPVASPETSTPSASPAANAEVIVTISGRAFSPAELTVPAGTTVTWVNADVEPHTATALDRDVLQSGTIMPGAQFGQVFPEARTYDYFCELHEGMSATLIVE